MKNLRVAVEIRAWTVQEEISPIISKNPKQSMLNSHLLGRHFWLWQNFSGSCLLVSWKNNDGRYHEQVIYILFTEVIIQNNVYANNPTCNFTFAATSCKDPYRVFLLKRKAGSI